MTYSYSWDETSPAGSSNISLGDDRIRELKVQIRERLLVLIGGDYYPFIPPGTKMLFYQDTAPTGWTIDNTLNDKLVFITKGSAAGGQTGGGAHSTGSWTISGLTGPSHTHTGPSHTHSVPRDGWGEQLNTVGGRLRTGNVDEATGDNTTGAGGTGETGAAGTGTVSSNATWRPAAYNCIICSRD
jgi:hypothetical protein